MIVYNEEANQEIEIYWPEPVEQIWQHKGANAQRTDLARSLAPQLPHLSLADILFMSAVVNLEERPHGLVTWTADMFGLSRVSLYALQKRVNARLGSENQLCLPAPPAVKEEVGRYIQVNKNRLNRFILASMFPGNVSIRPTQELLEEAFGVSYSVGYISQLRQEAGQQAGQILANINYANMGPVIILRDETFFDGYPVLILVDPLSTAIIGAYVCTDRTSDTWATVLLEAQSQGLLLSGLVEDMASMYPQSLLSAELTTTTTQKDVWHFLTEAGKVRRLLERQAYGAIGKVDMLEKSLQKQWDELKFEQEYIPAVAAEARRIDRYDQFAQWSTHLADSLLLVDLPSGEIRDFDTNHWLMNHCLTAFAAMSHPAIKAFAKKLRKHQAQLLTFLSWSATSIAAYTSRLAFILPDASARQQFMRSAAKVWALKQAVINGHCSWRSTLTVEQGLLTAVTSASPLLHEAAHQLGQILDASRRASSLVEMVNGLLKSFLKNRKHFPSATHLQSYLNLFVLWHNSRTYASRNKRGQASPFELAGIELPTSDWLTLLGFPPTE